jgi:hypothetical protein
MDIAKLQLVQSKMLANGDEYFSLYEKHIPRGLGKDKLVLVYEIHNIDCMMNIISLNPEAGYIVVGNEASNQALKMMLDDNVNVQYMYNIDDDSKFKKLNMKFDCIVMNPPYNRGVHIKILDHAKTYLVNNGKIVSLQPIVKWQEAILHDSPLPVEGIYVLDRFSMSNASQLFGINQRCDLGIVSNSNANISIVDNLNLLVRIKTKLKKAILTGGLLKDTLEKTYKSFPVNFGYGMTIAGHGGRGKACYRILGTNETNSTRREEIGHCARYNAIDANEQHLVWSFYTNQMIRFIAKEFGFGGIPYNIIPFMTGFVDDNGKTPLDEEWSFEKLARWFELDYNDIAIIRQSLDTYLHSNEQQIIEETMEKFKI